MLSVAYKNDPGTRGKTETGILNTLAYFSIFQYPLTRDEIKNFLPPGASPSLLDKELEQLVANRDIFRIEDFYLLQNDASLVRRRRDGNLRAEQLLPKAKKIGKFLFNFPYVRGIGISGSLSKMYADENADIDFFIVTRANRLWIARTFMHLFKKFTFLTGNQHFYCMNYYVDENALKLQDQNVYTAMETITLIPVKGQGLHEFFTSNGWVGEWFEEYSAKENDDTSAASRMKGIVEWLFNTRFGNWLDNYLMKWTTRRWQKKKQIGRLNHAGRTMDLITGKHFARSNPAHFQEKVLERYEEKISVLKG